jgi:antitoxin component YwqK of YwqJK toxin-antitoxin module
MNRILCLLILVSASACGQVHEILVTDTAYVNLRYLEDSVKYLSLRENKNLKGQWIIYYDESKKHKALEAAFKKGKLTGAEQHWYEDGKLLSEKKCVNDTCTTDYFYRSGTLMKRDIETINAVTGIRNWFYSSAYCDNGQIKYSPPLNPSSKDAQLITSYYCSGVKKEEYTLLLVGGKHLRIRHYTEWYENGTPKTVGYYNDVITDSTEKKTGPWNYYNAEGKFTRQERYEDGELKDSMQY